MDYTLCQEKVWAILVKVYIYGDPQLQAMLYEIERSKYILLISHTYVLTKG